MLHDLFASGIPITEKLLRTLLVYAFLLIGLRLAGKREMGQLNPFDFVVLLLLANTVQNAIIGNDNSLVGGIIGATALLIVNWFVVRYLYTHPAIARITFRIGADVASTWPVMMTSDICSVNGIRSQKPVPQASTT